MPQTDLTRDLANLIKKALPGARVRVEDPMNDGAHLTATVEAPQFEGISRIAQHRLVYAALGGAFENNLHALQLTTKTPEN